MSQERIQELRRQITALEDADAWNPPEGILQPRRSFAGITLRPGENTVQAKTRLQGELDELLRNQPEVTIEYINNLSDARRLVEIRGDERNDPAVRRRATERLAELSGTSASAPPEQQAEEMRTRRAEGQARADEQRANREELKRKVMEYFGTDNPNNNNVVNVLLWVDALQEGRVRPSRLSTDQQRILQDLGIIKVTREQGVVLRDAPTNTIPDGVTGTVSRGQRTVVTPGFRAENEFGRSLNTTGTADTRSYIAGRRAGERASIAGDTRQDALGRTPEEQRLEYFTRLADRVNQELLWRGGTQTGRAASTLWGAGGIEGEAAQVYQALPHEIEDQRQQQLFRELYGERATYEDLTRWVNAHQAMIAILQGQEIDRNAIEKLIAANDEQLRGFLNMNAAEVNHRRNIIAANLPYDEVLEPMLGEMQGNLYRLAEVITLANRGMGPVGIAHVSRALGVDDFSGFDRLLLHLSYLLTQADRRRIGETTFEEFGLAPDRRSE